MDFKDNKTFYLMIKAAGCYSALFDAKKFTDILLQSGYRQIDNFIVADLILILTCSTSAECESELLKTMSQFYVKKKQKAPMVILGCMAKTHREMLIERFGCPIFNAHQEDEFADFLGVARSKAEKILFDDRILTLTPILKFRKKFYVFIRKLNSMLSVINKGAAKRVAEVLDVSRIFDKESYALKISEGCAGSCSYCIIKKARGNIVSRPIFEIVEEARKAFQKGYRHFVLVCDEFSAYGRDIGSNYINLLKEIFAIDRCISVSLSNVSPQFFLKQIDEFLFLIDPGRVVSIEYTLQHGSNVILKKMQRGHTIEEFISSVNAIRRKYSGIKFKTHLMVGFPGESKDDFKKMLNLLDKVLFERIAFYRYTDRPGTLSAKLDNKVPKSTILRRYYHVKLRYNWKILLYRLFGTY